MDIKETLQKLADSVKSEGIISHNYEGATKKAQDARLSVFAKEIQKTRENLKKETI
jgi:hypothetical protein